MLSGGRSRGRPSCFLGLAGGAGVAPPPGPGGFVHAIFFDTAALRRLDREPSSLLSWQEWFTRNPDAKMVVVRQGRGQFNITFDNGSHWATAPHFELEDDADGRWWIMRHPAAP